MKKASLTDLTSGHITHTLFRFAIPMILGNLLQQGYNLTDTLIVGHFLGAKALAAVGSSYTLTVFITSIFIGLCMGSSAIFSIQYGAKNYRELQKSIAASLWITGGITMILNITALIGISTIINWLQTPAELTQLTYDYLIILFWGMGATFLYNYCAYLLRALGNSLLPLIFLGISIIINIILDLFFIIHLEWGIQGAAAATVIAQAISAIGLCIYTLYQFPFLRLTPHQLQFNKRTALEITTYSSLTCIQQSVMNLGILLVQGLVNSFGTNVMAAFAIAVKIDSLAYMPAQDFGNAFSVFIAQNFGAKRVKRIFQGIKSAFITSLCFCLIISLTVFIAAPHIITLFISSSEQEIIQIGSEYLRIEGSFYPGIGVLFLLYGFYRAIYMPGMSVVLTLVSLGLRVVLSYLLSSLPSVGIYGIWWSIPIGWILADALGIWYYHKYVKTNLMNHSK